MNKDELRAKIAGIIREGLSPYLPPPGHSDRGFAFAYIDDAANKILSALPAPLKPLEELDEKKMTNFLFRQDFPDTPQSQTPQSWSLLSQQTRDLYIDTARAICQKLGRQRAEWVGEGILDSTWGERTWTLNNEDIPLSAYEGQRVRVSIEVVK